MNKKRAGLFLLILGGIVVIASNSPSITGNVISEKSTNLTSFVGVLFIISGLILSLAPSLERTLSSSQREEIKSAFRGWDGRRLNGSQKKLLKKYGLEHEMNGRDHNKFYFPNSSSSATFSHTTSDYRAGLNFALKQLIPYIEENYNRQ